MASGGVDLLEVMILPKNKRFFAHAPPDEIMLGLGETHGFPNGHTRQAGCFVRCHLGIGMGWIIRRIEWVTL